MRAPSYLVAAIEQKAPEAEIMPQAGRADELWHGGGCKANDVSLPE